MGAILPHSRLTHNMDNASFMQFFYNLLLILEAPIANIPQLTALWNLLKAAIQRLDNSFKWPTKATETKQLKELDAQRDGILTIMFNLIRDSAKYSVDPIVKASAERLKEIADNYAVMRTRNYEGETSLIINFVQELEIPENLEHINRIGLGNNLTALKTKNSEFETLYISRNQMEYTHVISGTTSRLRKGVVTAFGDFNTAIEGLLLMETDPDRIAELHSIVNNINAEIMKATAVLDRHLGTTASGDGSSTNDKEPDVIIVLPDIDNPAAPDMPPQAPENTPPAINPDDLNPPAAGEH
ncbi:MAG: DUF6261 family protein [Tannerellaceae bacterium]|nr:DUF6261 family protein [Tannerellaceae bacterium]